MVMGQWEAWHPRHDEAGALWRVKRTLSEHLTEWHCSKRGTGVRYGTRAAAERKAAQLNK